MAPSTSGKKHVKHPNGGASPERLRAYWAARQGMGGGLANASPAAVLARTGWVRSVGGCNPYLALRDRAGLSREAVDNAVAALQICELPSARGCTYVVPAEDFAVALRAGQGHGDVASIATAKKYLGVTDKELERLSSRVLDAVDAGPLDPASIKEAVGSAVRSLGAEGKKRGVGTTLPLVLGRLQSLGELRRVPTGGRLDQQRYRYARWSPSPLAKRTMSDADVAMELGRRFFRWAGPATVSQLAWWAGLGMKAARATAMELGVVPVGEGEDRLLFADDRDALLAFEVPREPRISFVASLDNLLHLRREVLPHLDPDDVARKVPGTKKGESLGAIADLAYHAITDRGRVVGLWEWDGSGGELAWATFGKAPKGTREAADDLARYVERDLGDVRSFSLDSPESRAPRVDDLRAARW